MSAETPPYLTVYMRGDTCTDIPVAALNLLFKLISLLTY